MKDHAALIIHDGRKVLFAQRSALKKSLPNIWAFPSGTVEAGEKPETTAEREAQEELDIAIRVEKILAVTELPELGVRLHFAACGVVSGEPVIKEPKEIQAMRWLTFEEFFAEYSDSQIGHGLIYLRQHPEIWSRVS